MTTQSVGSTGDSPKMLVHIWGGSDASGNCIPECRARDAIPTRIDPSREKWSLINREITCNKCLCIRGLQGLNIALNERGFK